MRGLVLVGLAWMAKDGDEVLHSEDTPMAAFASTQDGQHCYECDTFLPHTSQRFFGSFHAR
jgi:hypothetical protein